MNPCLHCTKPAFSLWAWPLVHASGRYRAVMQTCIFAFFWHSFPMLHGSLKVKNSHCHIILECQLVLTLLWGCNVSNKSHIDWGSWEHCAEKNFSTKEGRNDGSLDKIRRMSQLHNFYISPISTRMTKSNSSRSTKHVTCKKETKSL